MLPPGTTRLGNRQANATMGGSLAYLRLRQGALPGLCVLAMSRCPGLIPSGLIPNRQFRATSSCRQTGPCGTDLGRLFNRTAKMPFCQFRRVRDRNAPPPDRLAIAVGEAPDAMAQASDWYRARPRR